MNKPNNRSISQAQHRIETELLSLGYRPYDRNTMIKDSKIITFSCSSEFNRDYMVIFWREHWLHHFAHIYDFWAINGPTCIVPIKILFESSFIKKKKELPSHDNNPYTYKGNEYYWWRQKVKLDHELAKLVLHYKDCWYLL